ncbi:MAG: GTPase ObgE [Nitrospirae bacterium]|nr:GTPase ObgE [Nitrospirota bacterium]
MKFVDLVTVYCKAGDGGAGCVSFCREKFKPRGGPDGGDGGKGGDIVFRAVTHLNTLLDHKYKKHYAVKRGGHGMGKDKHGYDSPDVVIDVPVGTVIKNFDTDETLADLTEDGMLAVILKGGRGGKGNAHFKSSTFQAPKFAQPGEGGEEANLTLELKLIADVGIIGMPNAGKSTLISSITASHAKIAPYPFTTLVPNLGVVKLNDYSSFIVADIPGIIEGAHNGAGLGLQFLRHAQRSKLLIHMIDVSQEVAEDPIVAYEKLNRELSLYSVELSQKPQLVAASKIDVEGDGKQTELLADFCRGNDIPFFPVSAVTHEGINALIAYISERLKKM